VYATLGLSPEQRMGAAATYAQWRADTARLDESIASLQAELARAAEADASASAAAAADAASAGGAATCDARERAAVGLEEIAGRLQGALEARYQAILPAAFFLYSRVLDLTQLSRARAAHPSAPLRRRGR
jgi:hypothetical protein